jgi:hypothetical protein
MSRKRSIKKTPYRLRAQGRCAKERLQQKDRLTKGTVYTLVANVVTYLSFMLRIQLYWKGVLNLLQYRLYSRVLYENRKWRYRPPPRINSLQESWCWSFLRFRKIDLWRLSDALLLPAEFQLDNGSWTTNQEMLIVTLLRLAHTSSWIELEALIQIEYSRMSRIFHVRIYFVYILYY